MGATGACARKLQRAKIRKRKGRENRCRRYSIWYFLPRKDLPLSWFPSLGEIIISHNRNDSNCDIPLRIDARPAYEITLVETDSKCVHKIRAITEACTYGVVRVKDLIRETQIASMRCNSNIKLVLIHKMMFPAVFRIALLLLSDG